MTKVSMSRVHRASRDETAVRRRILEAAFAAFMKSGYAAASTLEIASRAALRKLMAGAQEAGLLNGRPAELAEHFIGLLWRDLLVSLLLGVTERPGPREIAARARGAAVAFLQLYPLPG